MTTRRRDRTAATSMSTRRRSRARGGRRHRVGRRHGRGQPDDDAGQHALEAGRPDDRRREPGDRLAVPGRRPGEDPAGQRDGLRPSDAPPLPHPRRRPVPRSSAATASTSPTWSGKTRCWCDTGETVDILLDVTNPGIWMAHCHIAEHHESGMMFSFHVDPSRSRPDDRDTGSPSTTTSP